MPKRPLTLIAITLSLLVPLGCVSAAPYDRAARLQEIESGEQTILDKFVKHIAEPGAEITERDLPNYALGVLALGDDPKIADSMLREGFGSQVMDPQAADYGKLPWIVGNAEVNDANAIEFGTQAVGPILLDYSNKLSPDLIAWLKPHIVASFAALRRHKVPVSYTNIFLMKATSLLLLGQAIGDAQAQADGADMMSQWIDYTKTYGIHEFDSPTYYDTDLDSLYLGYKFAASADVKARYKAGLDILWTDIAANFFAPRNSLSGPHSRDYDFVNGNGTLESYTYVEGLGNVLSKSDLTPETNTLIESMKDGQYRLSDQMLALAHMPVRVVKSRSDVAPNFDRYNYITPDFTVGSACGDYCPQDKMVDIELAAPTILPQISVVQDPFDSPYGVVKQKDRSGHDKPYHLPSHPVCVQDKGVVLEILDAGQSKPLDAASLGTDVVLPAKADCVLLDGKPVTVTGPFETDASPTSTVAVRVGDAGVAVRILSASATSGQPSVKLEADAIGLRKGLIRLAIYEYGGPQATLPPSTLPVALLFDVENVQNDADLAALESRVAKADAFPTGAGSGSFGYRVNVGATSLECAMHLPDHKIVARRVNGVDVSAPVLAVNDTDLATPILK